MTQHYPGPHHPVQSSVMAFPKKRLKE